MHEMERGWLPVRAALHSTGLYFALRKIGPEELQDAFMYETMVRVPAQETIVHVTEATFGKATLGTAPAGLIFHVGRCGSTLLSQLLKKCDGLVVYAEPQAVNEILVPPHEWPRRELVAALRSLGVAFARHAGRPYVLKLSSWNTLFCDILLEAFPDTPWVFNVRDPLEVGVSELRVLPGWFRADEESSRRLAKVVDPRGVSKSPEEYAARAYGALCTAAERLGARRGKLIPYEALPSAVWDIIAPHFSLPVDDEQRHRMAEGARRNAKTPVGERSTFVPDSATKQAAASIELRQAVDAFARPELERLMRLHASVQPPVSKT